MSTTPNITSSHHYIEHALRQRLIELGTVLESDIITLIAPMYTGVTDMVRIAIEEIISNNPEITKNLSIILETDGGSIEVVEQIANILRHHYAQGEIKFIIPNRAMSAGTVLVMCGDHILMNYHSVLGPIDPQVISKTTGNYVPALGYLEKFNELVDKSNKGTISAAELTFMIGKFDPAELVAFKNARDLSTELLEKWLTKYKFKNWHKTETRKIKVDDKRRTKRARKIAQTLNSTKIWKSHSRGIPMTVLQNDLDLIIEDYGQTIEIKNAIDSYYKLLQDYMTQRGKDFVIQNKNRITFL